MATVFNINGENGDDWSSYVGEGDNTFTKTSGSKKTGSYGFAADFAGTDDTAYGTKSHASQTEYWIGFHLYISSGYDIGTYNKQYMYWPSPFNVYMGFVSKEAVTPDRWNFGGSGLSDEEPTTNFSLGAWHWVVIHYKDAASNGGMTVKVDGTTVYDDMDQDTSGWSSQTSIILGGYVCNSGAPADGDYIYIDNVIMDDAGEPSEPTDGVESIIPYAAQYIIRMRRTN